ncbi:MAG: zf-HC2 domain-containing protein [Anaerolineae bacterium]|nr:zf-HC2 domain-containing protein [Anaerolineae bacterium]
MECERMLASMMCALDGELGAREQADLEAHVAQCAACRTEWERLHALEQVLRHVPPVAPPVGFAGRVAARVDRRHHHRRVVLGAISLGLGGMTAAVLLVGPALLSLSASAGAILPLLEAGRVTLGRLCDATLALLGSFWVTLGALALPAALLAVGGLAMAMAANLAWLGLVCKLRYPSTQTSIKT